MLKRRRCIALFLSVSLASAHIPSIAFSQPSSAGQSVSVAEIGEGRQVLREAINLAAQNNPSPGTGVTDRTLLNGVYQGVSQRPDLARPIVEAAKGMRPDLSDIIERVGQRAITNTAGYSASTGVAVSSAASVAGTAATASAISTPLVVGGLAVAAAAGVAVAAASGGGSSSSSSSTASTLEYAYQPGLAMINASSAYARGGSGEGITVAVLDSGVDVTHPDIAANIAAGGYNVVDNNTDVSDSSGHGTHVAGTIAARKDGGNNPYNMHGVAYNAKILPVQIFDYHSLLGYYTTTPYIVAGTNYAISQGVDVINGSYGVSYADSSYTQQIIDASSAQEAAAYQAAADAGIILVFAAGNDYRDNPTVAVNPAGQSLFPYVKPANASSGVYTGGAGYDFSGLEGMLITVVSVDVNGGTISNFSNRCGVAASWCIAAPGNPINSLEADGTYTRMSGTSMAAPHVSGAVAVLLEMFPELTPEEIVQRVFLSADKTGAYANSAIYGQGMLDLEAASRPLGSLSVATGQSVYNTGTNYTLAASNLRLGHAFGDGLTKSLNGRSMAVFDAQKATFYVDMGSLTRMAGSGFDMDGALRRFRSRFGEQNMQLGNGGTLSYAFVDLNRSRAVQQDPTMGGDGTFMEMAFSQKFGDATIDMQYNVNPSAMLGLHRSENLNSNTMLSRDALAVPYLSFAQQGYSMGSRFKVSDSVSISTGAFRGYPLADELLPEEERAESYGNVVEVAYETGALKLFSQAGMLSERKTLLGSRTSGAFGMDSGGYTGFAGMNAAYDLSDRWSFVGTYYSGYTEPDLDSSSLFSSISDLKSEAFSVGLLGRDVVSKGDQFGLVGNQPLRVSGGDATMAIATGRSQGGALYTESYAVNLAPTGRELNLELFYHYNLPDSDMRLMSSLMYRTEPGHIENAPDEGVVLLQLQQSF